METAAAARSVATLLLVGLVTLPVAGEAQVRRGDERTPVPLGQRLLVVRNATVIDGTGGEPRPNVRVLIQGGEIVAVGSLEGWQVPAGTEVVDAEGGYLLPGFVDVRAVPRDGAGLPGLLAAGVTTAAVPGLPGWEQADDEAPVRSADLPTPRLFVSPGVVAGPGSERADGLPVSTPDEARRAVRTLTERGADFVAVTGAPSAETMLALVREARRRGLDVAGELDGAAWVDAARVGFESLAGLAALPGTLLEEPEGAAADRLLGALLGRDVMVAPGLAEAEARWAQGGSAPDEARWAGLLRLTGLLHAERVRLLAGSGPSVEGGGPGERYHRELALLVEAGLSPSDVLGIATRNGAAVLDVLHRSGTIEPGKRADLVLVTEDPTQDVAGAAAVRWVMLEGRVRTPEEILAGGR